MGHRTCLHQHRLGGCRRALITTAASVTRRDGSERDRYCSEAPVSVKEELDGAKYRVIHEHKLLINF